MSRSGSVERSEEEKKGTVRILEEGDEGTG